uniref:Uncharacterized protein n=1 Tax=Avena sativa TaxID=4498 RepID=A0ACD5VMQ6_AVESA
MANFEVEPERWLPWGHQIIDGGGTRLPRTYYYAAQDPLPQHQAWCVAIVEPKPPGALQEQWRNQVRDFLVGPLNRNVVEDQPSLFGVGLFQLSGPNACHALVQHGHFQLNNRFVRFVFASDAENHRSEQGFRHGWLMFLGIPPDYRTDLHIANAVMILLKIVKFQFWNNNDPIKDRVLVYASFPSPQLVPRDVTFGKFATVGGVKESWSAAVFIPSADFADALPAAEDPMPPDGNPHPLPGNLMQNDNLFVGPQYPEIGWDAAPWPHDQEDAGQQGNVPQQGDGMHDDQAEQDSQESFVMNASAQAASSEDMEAMGLQQQPNLELNVVPAPGPVYFDFLQVGRVHVFGPAIPPDMLWRRMFESMMPFLLSSQIPLALQSVPFEFLKLKRSWADAFDADKLWSFNHIPNQIAMKVHPRLHSKVARTLNFEQPDHSESSVSDPVFSATPDVGNKRRAPKTKRQILQPTVCRFTRSCLKKDGMRPHPIIEGGSRPKKKIRAKMLVVGNGTSDGGKDDQENQATIPATSVRLMQSVGVQLGIHPSKLTRDELEAGLSGQLSKESDDY